MYAGAEAGEVKGTEAKDGVNNEASLGMFAKYKLLLPVVEATSNCAFGDQLVIEYEFFGPAPTLLLVLDSATALFGDQLVITYDVFASPETPLPPPRFDM
jgi:hypothetical protein